MTDTIGFVTKKTLIIQEQRLVRLLMFKQEFLEDLFLKEIISDFFIKEDVDEYFNNEKKIWV